MRNWHKLVALVVAVVVVAVVGGATGAPQQAYANPDIPIVDRKGAAPDSWLCALGLAKAVSSDYAYLPPMENAAIRMTGVLTPQPGYGVAHVRLLANQDGIIGGIGKNDDPTKANLEGCITNLKKKAGGGQIAVVYLATHGNRRDECLGLTDDDNDGGTVNDGCPAIKAKEEGDDQCKAPDNKDNDGDGRVNDGCPAVGAPEGGADPGGDEPAMEHTSFLPGQPGASPASAPDWPVPLSNKGPEEFFLVWAAPADPAAPEAGAQCANGVDDDGDERINDGCPQVGPTIEKDQCLNAAEDDGDGAGAINDGCAPVGPPEAGANCGNAADDDGDGLVNDGCPQVGPTAEINQCRNGAEDDGDGPGAINDGCPAVANRPGLVEISDNDFATMMSKPSGFAAGALVTVIIEQCFAGGHADGAKDLGKQLRDPRAILMASEANQACGPAVTAFRKEGVDDEFLKGTPILNTGAFSNYLIKGLEVVARVATPGCASLTTTRADRGVDPNPSAGNPAIPAGNNDCVTTSAELFYFAAGRTAQLAADDDNDGTPDNKPVTETADVPRNTDFDGPGEKPLEKHVEDPPDFLVGVFSDNDGDGAKDEDGYKQDDPGKVVFPVIDERVSCREPPLECRQYPKLSLLVADACPPTPSPTQTPTPTPTQTPAPTQTPIPSPSPAPGPIEACAEAVGGTADLLTDGSGAPVGEAGGSGSSAAPYAVLAGAAALIAVAAAGGSGWYVRRRRTP